MVYAVIRRRNVGIVFSELPAKKPALEGRQLFGSADDKPWMKVSDGVRKKLVLSTDGSSVSPVGEVWETRAEVSFNTGPAPFGEFDIFFTGRFSTEGKVMEPYAVRYFESEVPAPPILSESDGGLVIAAKFDRPVLPTSD